MAELVERRRSRSPFRGEAADLYLDALSRRCGLRAAVLADEEGLPVAGAGPRSLWEPLSAFGAEPPGAADRAPRGDKPRSVPIRIGSARFSLTVLGTGELPREDTQRDLARILGMDQRAWIERFMARLAED
jgi:hypothetical protein